MRRVQVISTHLHLALTLAWPRRDFWSFSILIGIFTNHSRGCASTHRARRSMADQDTDRYIFEVNAIDLRRKMRNLQDKVQWTDLV